MDERTSQVNPTDRVEWIQTIHRSASGDVTFSYQGLRVESATACGHQHPTPFFARKCALDTAAAS